MAGQERDHLAILEQTSGVALAHEFDQIGAEGDVEGDDREGERAHGGIAPGEPKALDNIDADARVPAPADGGQPHLGHQQGSERDRLGRQRPREARIRGQPAHRRRR